MTRTLLITLVLVAYIIYVAFKHKNTWKKLSLLQITGVFFTFLGVVSISGIILFYGNRYVATVISGDIISFLIKFFAIIILIAIAGITFAAIASKITNDIIPSERRDQK